MHAIAEQDLPSGSFETIIVDSGSTDDTLAIAGAYNPRIVPIAKEQFTFGRSLNVGCEAARGRNLVFVSGHCIPTGPAWLKPLLAPLESGAAHYVYGRQAGHEMTRFSERQIFGKYFPERKADAQGGFFCNNANAALRRDVWARHRFDEDITGLEDMELAKRLIAAGLKVDYVPESVIYHIHDESWAKVRSRYERESLALQKITPELHLSLFDFTRYFLSALVHDVGAASREGPLLRLVPEIFMFRLMQYWGAYCGNNDHRVLSRKNKDRYFYPK
jgi:glycosyltransferase involved in cell wall biosynthesis